MLWSREWVSSLIEYSQEGRLRGCTLGWSQLWAGRRKWARSGSEEFEKAGRGSGMKVAFRVVLVKGNGTERRS